MPDLSSKYSSKFSTNLIFLADNVDWLAHG